MRGTPERPQRPRARSETRFVEHAYIEPEAGYAAPAGPDTHRDRRPAPRRPTWTARRPRACSALTARERAHPAHRLRRRLRRQARRLGAAAARGRGLEGAPAGAHRLYAHRVDGLHDQAASGDASGPRASADAQGRLTRLRDARPISTPAPTPPGGRRSQTACRCMASGPYRSRTSRTARAPIYTNDPPAGAFRGFGVPQAAIAHEGADGRSRRGARARPLGHPPLQCAGQWRPDALGPGAGAFGRPAGVPRRAEGRTGTAALARVATHNAAAPRRRRGVGIACMWYGCGNTALPNPSTMRIALSRDGTLTFFNGAVDIGQGSTTVLTADRRGCAWASAGDVPPRRRRHRADGGRRQDLRLAPDLRLRQGRDARRPGSAPEDPGACQCRRERGAGARGRDARHPRRRRPAPRRSRRACRPTSSGIVLEGLGAYDPPTTALDADGQGVPYATYGFAAQMAEVEVDTGPRHDEGAARSSPPTTSAAPSTRPSSRARSMAASRKGLGFALMEEFIPGRTENLHDYLIPTVGDMPAIDIRLIEDPEPEGPFGAKGVGEPALDRDGAGDPVRHPPRHRRVTRVPCCRIGCGRRSADGGCAQSPSSPKVGERRCRLARDAAPTRLSPAAGERAGGRHDNDHSPAAPRNSAPPKADGIVRCDACPVLCRIRPGRAGACAAMPTRRRARAHRSRRCSCSGRWRGAAGGRVRGRRLGRAAARSGAHLRDRGRRRHHLSRLQARALHRLEPSTTASTPSRS